MLSRKWTTYAVKATFAEKPPDLTWPEISDSDRKAHEENLLPDWDMRAHVLPSRILCQGEFKQIVSLQRSRLGCRLYPPFPLSEKGGASGLFSEITLPAGKVFADHQTQISKSATTGLIIEPKTKNTSFYCRGIRMDVQNGFDTVQFLTQLIDQLAIYTHQWWLRSGHDPFNGPYRLGGKLNRDFEVADELRFHGAGEVESYWHAVNSSQMLIGLEKPLTETLWIQCLTNVAVGMPAERGLLLFLDAIAAYMANDDDNCIFNLSLSFEILANKRYYAENRKHLSSNKKLQEKSSLLDSSNRDEIHALIIDRDHVAHGRKPYLLGNKGWTIEKYIEAGTSVVNNYLKQLGPNDWPELSRLVIGSTRR